MAGDEAPEPASCSSEIDIEARTPMLRRYSRWIGETLRSVEYVRSTGSAVAKLVTGTRGDGV